MHGVNKVVISGSVTGRILFATTGQGAAVCTFIVASERPTKGAVLTAHVKVNVYAEFLVAACRAKLAKGCYVLVEGELMNRETPNGRLLEVRAWELIFPNSIPNDRGAALDDDADDRNL
jgi:single-stranded DNA-binding protein